jgi:hypothetical protein
VTNVHGQIHIVQQSVNYEINACIHMLGEFAKGSGDPKYRLSAQLPVYGSPATYDTHAAQQWYPDGTTTTDSANGGNPNGRHLLEGRSLLSPHPGGGGQ